MMTLFSKFKHRYVRQMHEMGIFKIKFESCAPMQLFFAVSKISKIKKNPINLSYRLKRISSSFSGSAKSVHMAIQCLRDTIADGSQFVILDELGTLRMNPKAAEGRMEFKDLRLSNHTACISFICSANIMTFTSTKLCKWNFPNFLRANDRETFGCNN